MRPSRCASAAENVLTLYEFRNCPFASRAPVITTGLYVYASLYDCRMCDGGGVGTVKIAPRSLPRALRVGRPPRLDLRADDVEGLGHQEETVSVALHVQCCSPRPG